MSVAFSVQDLRFKYPSAKEDTLKGISFEVKEGEIFGLLGPSGAGKSTTQKILIKLLEDYKGSVKYFGKDLKDLGKSYYEEIGVGFEVPVHFSKLTALENLKFYSGFYKSKADIRELMERVGLWEYRDKKVGEFSKGMKVRLNFVRALLNKPRVLFLDEVTNGLDPKNARIIKDMIAEYRKDGGTVFLSTHLMNDVEQLCDRIAFCVNGSLVEVSTPRELKLKYGKREVKVEYNENGNLSTAVFSLDGIGENEEFVNLLKSKQIETIHSGETSMEEIFIIVTGVELNERTEAV
ncbi:MAG: ABC transporter ATP-binding protein [Clostridiales bacterium]|nr:ABC transporter ATP-binding protein [Clostridiales bacterium]HOA34419.1 ABC transporter ATP-binding protein [Clostridiales bacterium]HQA04924.1 ABC transporter ATP-binding protein [Clostridiales bacterium]HQD73037.1 ABC transporter ATP-binding protein [Clostridiales bacterium]